MQWASSTTIAKILTKSPFSSSNFLRLERTIRASGLVNRWFSTVLQHKGTNLPDLTARQLMWCQCFEVWRLDKSWDTRGEITITQGTEQVGLASESCSRIVEVHRGSAWKMADFPNAVGTVTTQSRPSKTHQIASLFSCLTDEWPSFQKTSMALLMSSILALVLHFRWSACRIAATSTYGALERRSGQAVPAVWHFLLATHRLLGSWIWLVSWIQMWPLLDPPVRSTSARV